MGFNNNNMTAPCDDDIEPPTAEECRAAQRVVAGFVSRDHPDEEITDAMRQETADYLLMLGLYPGQDAETFKAPLYTSPYLM
jgi:hypothetical protein